MRFEAMASCARAAVLALCSLHRTEQLAYYKDTSKHCTEPRRGIARALSKRCEAGRLHIAPTRSAQLLRHKRGSAARGAAQTSTMPSAAKRSREAQDDKPAPKRQRGAATGDADSGHCI